MTDAVDLFADDETADELGHQSSFIRSSWRWGGRRLDGAASAAAFGVGLLSQHSGAFRALGLLALVEIVLMALPWRVPRGRRSGLSFWAESLCGTVASVGAVIVAVTTRPHWWRETGAWPWYIAAVALGCALILVSGLAVRSAFNGELAFVLGPTRRSHAAARCYATVAGTFGEEVLFRTPGALWISSTPLALLGATAFVGRHYVQAGSNRRGSIRGSLVEICAAAGLLAITAASGSIYPAVLAHLINNVPQLVIEVQRENGVSNA